MRLRRTQKHVDTAESLAKSKYFTYFAIYRTYTHTHTHIHRTHIHKNHKLRSRSIGQIVAVHVFLWRIIICDETLDNVQFTLLFSRTFQPAVICIPSDSFHMWAALLNAHMTEMRAELLRNVEKVDVDIVPWCAIHIHHSIRYCRIGVVDHDIPAFAHSLREGPHHAGLHRVPVDVYITRQ